MAILRQENWLGQQRVDVPQLRSIESASCGDFDMLVGRALAGAQALVVTGFDINNPAAAIGSAASGLQLNVANGILINLNASESGSMLWVSNTATSPVALNPVTNTKVQGSFTPSTYNYIGLDLTRTADTTTSDLVEFLDPDTDLEDPEIVPLARTLSYTIVISTATFASQPNLVPIAIVLTDGSNNVASAGITDARNLYGRLGLGGDTPNAAFQYAWPQGRAEDENTNVFQGGDKAIGSQKDWMNATMSRIWEIGGGEYWYGRTADRNVNMNTTGAALGNGQWFDYSGGAISWTGVSFVFDNSSNAGVYYNDVENSGSPVTIGDGYCMYVILDRTTNHVRGVNGLVMQGPVLLTELGSGLNYADVQIVIWIQDGDAFTRGQSTAVGSPIPVATTSSDGIVRLFQTPGSSSHPVVLNLNAAGTLAWTATNEAGGPGNGLQVIAGSTLTNTYQGGTAIYGQGGAGLTTGEGGIAISGQGGTPGTTGVGGPGGFFAGGVGGSSSGAGGYGSQFVGGDASASGAQGGAGVYSTGGASGGGASLGGAGGTFKGGTTGSTATVGSYGIISTGSDAVDVTKQGGAGGDFAGGVGGSTSGTGGYGLESTGGAGGGTGAGGIGLSVLGGSAPGSGLGGNGINATGGSSSSGTGGYGLYCLGASGQVGALFDGSGNYGLIAINSNGGAYGAIDCRGYLYLGNGSDPGTTNPGEHVNRRNTIIGWARLTCSGTSTPTIADGYNVASVAFDGSGYVVVTLTTGASSGVLCAVANGNLNLDGGTLSGLPNIITTTASTVKMGGLSGSTIYSISASSNSGDIHVICTGYL